MPILLQRPGPILDSNGWSVFPPLAGDSTAIYVSKSTGSDGGLGTFASPYETVLKGMQSLNALPQNRPHRLCFKDTDEWPKTDYPGVQAVARSGRSDKELLMITSYDSSGNVPSLSGLRPKINIPNVDNAGFRTSGGLLTSGGIYIAIVGLHITCPEKNPDNPDFIDDAGTTPTPIQWRNPAQYMLIEDCELSYGKENIDCYAFINNLHIRRNIVHHAWVGGGVHSQGIFANSCSFILLEENFLYHNGWNLIATFGDVTPVDIFNHNVYVDGDDRMGSNDNSFKSGYTEAVGNVFSRPCANGFQNRTSGRIADNLYAHCGVQGFVAGKPGLVEQNVYLHGKDRAGTAWGPAVIQGAYDVIVRDNIVAHHESATTPAQAYEVQIGTPLDLTPRNTQFINNIAFNWGSTFLNDEGIGTTNIGAEHNLGGYTDSSRTLYSYDASIGGPGTEAHFINGGLTRPARTWPTQYTANAVNNYIRQGFNRPAYKAVPRYTGK